MSKRKHYAEERNAIKGYRRQDLRPQGQNNHCPDCGGLGESYDRHNELVVCQNCEGRGYIKKGD